MRPVQKMKSVGLVVLLLASLPLAAETNIGVVDLRRAVFGSDEASEFSQQLQEQFGGQEEAVRQAQQEANQLRQRLETDGAMMNESERQQAAREFQGKVQEFNQLRQQLDQAVSERRAQFLQEAQPDIDAALAAIREERDLDVILPREAVVYAKPELDVTEDLMSRLNEE